MVVKLDTKGQLGELAFQLSEKALARQAESLDEIRSRTGALVAASALAASFLGARAAVGDASLLTALAVGAFVTSIGMSLYVLFPRENLVFSVRGSALFEAEFAQPGGLPEVHRRLAYWLETYLDANEPTVKRLYWLYRGATLAVLAQVLLWVLEIVL